jgi:ubiquinone/menaquinone biosynthesis C-methylase UbiE
MVDTTAQQALAECLARGDAGHQYHTDCPVCHNSEASVYVQRPKVLWVKCPCGVIYKQWSAEAHTVSAPFDPAATHYSTRWGRRVAKSRNQIRDVLNFVSPGPVLDIGCSLGYTIHAAQQLGLKAQGVEYDPGVAQYCRSKGYAVETGSMTNLPFDSNAFQIVVMKHVLEHTHEPSSALREVWRVLKPNGGLMIAVPDGRYGKAIRDPYHCRFFDYADPDTGHCIYYTPTTLARLVVDCGFSVAHLHPQLIHRTAPAPLIAAQLVASPLTWLVERFRDAAHIRKEFWLVAVKRDQPRSA